MASETRTLSRIFRAPGRVNLIGEHTDYNDGFVLPAALDRATTVTMTPRADRIVTVTTALGGKSFQFDLDEAAPQPKRDWTDYVRGVAVVLEAADAPGIIDSRLGADGRYKELLWVPAGVSSGYDQTQQNAAFVEMRGSEVFKVAVTTLKDIAEQILVANQMSIADIDWLIPHQANRRILAATAKRLGLSEDRVVDCVRTHGNTSAASIPLALDVAVRDGRIQRGHTLLLEGFGGGFTWGATLLKY